MCGIVGVFGPPGDPACDDIATRVLLRMPHRGEPEKHLETDSGTGWCLGANRLAIISRPEGRQPLRSKSGRTCLVFNGEVYNYHDLSQPYDIDAQIDRDGDGALVVEHIERLKDKAISHFDGMFALIWHDAETGEAYASRDRLGIKPLYYAYLGSCLVFASEIKALAPEDAVREIHEVLPGTTVRVRWPRRGNPEISRESRYFALEAETSLEPGNIEELRSALSDSINSQCAYGSKLGVYLSGGVDSGGVFCIAQHLSHEMVPLALLGSENGVDGKAAARLTLQHGVPMVTDRCPTEDDLFARVDQTIAIVESFEPNVVRQSSVQFYIAQLAKKAGVKVILCGEGSDELFCGYPEFLTPNLNWKTLRYEFLRDLRRTQLQRVDRMSMWFTTEVRVPFLCNRLIDWALRSTDTKLYLNEHLGLAGNKWCLRKALEGFAPDWVRYRPKVVLSEGVGLSGNDPECGMFRKLADSRIGPARAREIRMDFPQWNLRTDEEAYYFEVFHRRGYSKAKFMRERVRANTVHSVVGHTTPNPSHD